MSSRKVSRIILHIILIAVAVVWIYPFFWMISASFKTNSELFASGLNLIPHSFSFDNFIRAWNKANFSTYFFNSLAVSLSDILIVVCITSLGGYAVGRYRFIGRKLILGLFIGSMTIPMVFTLIPIYEMLKMLHLNNSLFGLIFAEAGVGHVIFLLLYSSFFAQLPKEMSEAAEMDGCGFFRTFSTIMFPLVKPITTTVVILTFMWTWNEFMLPLTLTLSNPAIRTLSVGLYALKGENSVDWVGIAAGGTIATIPIILIFISLQKYFVEGIAGAVKS